MLRIGVMSLRPLSRVTASMARGVHMPPANMRNFSTFRQTIAFLKPTQKAPSTLSNALNSSRTFMTDSLPVATRPSQTDAWKRFAITAVSACFLRKCMASLRWF
jgi:growth hormone-inducible transmembrane protein